MVVFLITRMHKTWNDFFFMRQFYLGKSFNLKNKINIAPPLPTFVHEVEFTEQVQKGGQHVKLGGLLLI